MLLFVRASSRRRYHLIGGQRDTRRRTWNLWVAPLASGIVPFSWSATLASEATPPGKAWIDESNRLMLARPTVRARIASNRAKPKPEPV